MRPLLPSRGALVRRRVFAALLGLIGLALYAMPDRALAQLVPVNLRAAIFVRALSYERTFTSASGPAKLVVVRGASGEAAQDGAAMTRAFQEILRGNRTPRPVTVSELTYRDGPQTASAVRAEGPTVLYLPRGTYDVSERLGAARGLIVICAAVRDMERSCSLSVEIAGSSPRLVVNLAHADRSGLRFDARLLGLARVIR